MLGQSLMTQVTECKYMKVNFYAERGCKNPPPETQTTPTPDLLT